MEEIKNNTEEKKFTEEQKKAIESLENTVVAAGAGSGKTTVLAERFLNLVNVKHYSVDQILTLTFTKKATVEMSDRIYKVLKNSAPQEAANFYKANIKTLDSYCNTVAKLGCRFYGVSPDFVLDEEAVKNAAKEKALPFILKHKDNEAIKKIVDIDNYENVAEEIFVNPVIEHSTVAEPFEFRKYFEKQYYKIAEEWNKVVSKIEDLLNDADKLEETFEADGGNVKTEFWKKYLKIKNDVETPEKVKLTYEKVKAGEVENIKNYFFNIIQKKFPKPNRSKGADGFGEIIDALRDNYDKLAGILNYVAGVPFLNELIPLLEEFQEIVMNIKRTNGSLTYKDVSNMALCVLRDFPEIRQIEKKKYKAIMIDEFQDNNQDQKDMLFLLAEKLDRKEKGLPKVEELCKEKLFFVGDEKQSIYRFRGADVEVFNKLSNDFSDGKLSMSVNHRSEPALIAAFNTIFGGEVFKKDNQKIDEEFLEKKLPSVFFTEKDLKTCEDNIPDYEAVYHQVLVPEYKKDIKTERPLVNIAVFDSSEKIPDDYLGKEESEAEWVANKIEEIVAKKIENKEEVNYSEIAVLIQKFTNQSVFERTFLSHGIPYNTETVKGFFSDGPVCDIVAYLKLAVFPEDTVAYGQILRSPFVNLSLTEIEAVLAKKMLPFSEEVFCVLEDNSLERFKIAGENYRSFVEESSKSSLSGLISRLWYDFGYRFETMWNHTVEMYEKLYDLLFEKARQADEQNQNLSKFIDSISEYKNENLKLEDMDIPLEKTNGVRIMSIHKSKGLEFDTVFVCNTHLERSNRDNTNKAFFCKDYGLTIKTSEKIVKKLPSDNRTSVKNYFYQLGLEENENLQSAEMRRVTYVALTRAKKELYITSASYKKCEKDTDLNKVYEKRPGGSEYIYSVFDCIQPIVEFYSKEENARYSPFNDVEQIPFYERKDRINKGRNNSQKEKILLVKKLQRENPYENAEIYEKEREKSKYISPSKLHILKNENEIFNGNNSSIKENDDFAEILEIIEKRKKFDFTNFGTIAHSYMEALVSGIDIEKNPPYKNKDISGLEGSKTDLKAVENACLKMMKKFEKSALGIAAKKAAWKRCEYEFRSKVGGKIISGSMDLVFEDESGTYVIVDYKTNQTIEPKIYYEQLACYKQALSKIMNVDLKKIKCCLYYLRFAETVEITSKIENIDLEEVVERLA